MKTNILKYITLIVFVSSLNSTAQQNKVELSNYLNGIGMNTILPQIKDFNTRTEIKASDTIQYYYVNDSFFTILNHPVKRVLVKKVNGLVTEIAFRYEKKRIDAPQLYNEKLNGSKIKVIEGTVDAKDKGTIDNNEPKVVDINKEKPENDKETRTKKQKFIDFIDAHALITKKLQTYLTDNYQFISSQPNCQFDCFDKWESDYSILLIEKNNYLDQDGDNTIVFIDQSLLIKSKLSK